MDKRFITGKHAGKTLYHTAEVDPDYVRGMDTVKELISKKTIVQHNLSEDNYPEIPEYKTPPRIYHYRGTEKIITGYYFNLLINSYCSGTQPNPEKLWREAYNARKYFLPQNACSIIPKKYTSGDYRYIRYISFKYKNPRTNLTLYTANTRAYIDMLVGTTLVDIRSGSFSARKHIMIAICTAAIARKNGIAVNNIVIEYISYRKTVKYDITDFNSDKLYEILS